MVRLNKKLILIILLAAIFLLTGCDKFKIGTIHSSDDDPAVTVTSVPDHTGDNEVGDNDNSGDVSNNDSESEPNQLSPTPVPKLADVELPIYTINDDGALEPVTALVPEGSDITPQLVVDKVVESLADQFITIGIESVTQENEAVIVSFKKDQAPYVNMGSEYEANILNSFAQSLIDNIDSVKKVIFRVEGKAYESGSYAYGIDEPYMSQ